MTTTQKFAGLLCVIALALLTPGILHAFGVNSVADFTSQNFGMIGSTSVLSLIAFGLLTVTMLFATGEKLGPSILSLILGFFLVSTAVEIGFMGWFREFSANVIFLKSQPLNFLTGIVVVLLGIALSHVKQINFLGTLVLVLLLPLGFLTASNMMGWFSFKNDMDLSMNQGYLVLAQKMDEKYQEMPKVKEYLESLKQDETLTEEEKTSKVKDLQKNITKQEGDQKTLAELQEENKLFKELLEKQKEELGKVGFCTYASGSGEMAKSFEEAVNPEQPCVRDFAVSLVKNSPGPYFDTESTKPGEQGIKQICDLYVHLSSKWKYISDPTTLTRDFYSPADRTISLGLAGDCDDYSILMASGIEAIGGKARIMGGKCSDGGHAWAEVYIGDLADWNVARSRIEKYLSGRRNYRIIPTLRYGKYWLPLDWKIGHFTCNSNPDASKVLYISPSQQEL